MPAEWYALKEPEHGKAPAFRAIDDPTEAFPGEVVVDDPPEPGEVWDSAAVALRPKGDAEELAGLKAGKRAELEAGFAQACGADFSSPWVALGVLASSPQDARVTSLKGRTAVLQTKVRAVDQAATAAEVEAVSWT